MKTTIFAGRRALQRATRLLPLAVLAVGASLSTPAPAAWDGAVTGVITVLDSTANEPNNYELRIAIGGVTQFCNTTATAVQGFGYMNSGDVNFKGTLATLLMAYSAGKTVTVYTMNDSQVGCHIHYVSVHP